MSINLENSYSESLFEIKSNKKTLLLFKIMGITFIVIGVTFLYFFHMTLGTIGKGIYHAVY